MFQVARQQLTYYAGKSSTLKAVATTATCAIEGRRSAIGASQLCLFVGDQVL